MTDMTAEQAITELSAFHVNSESGLHLLSVISQALLTAAPAPADEPAEHQQAPCEWNNGEPSRVYRDEWFIAKMVCGRTVVARSLPEDHSYDYTTADETYFRADRITRWMQLPNSEFVSPAQYELATLRERVKELERYNIGLANESHELRERVKALEALEFTVKEFLEIQEVFRDFDGDRRGFAENLSDAEGAMISALASLRGGSDE